MASVPLGQVNAPQPGPALLDAVREQGSASHPYNSSPELLSGPAASRNLADAIHFLCALHGRHPGVVELAAMRTFEPAARPWLAETAEAFARERGYLARLAVQAGRCRRPRAPAARRRWRCSATRSYPGPSGAARLRESARRGAADWGVVEGVDCAATRFGMTRRPPGARRGGFESRVSRHRRPAARRARSVRRRSRCDPASRACGTFSPVRAHAARADRRSRAGSWGA
jgi:hypothetical protein